MSDDDEYTYEYDDDDDNMENGSDDGNDSAGELSNTENGLDASMESSSGPLKPLPLVRQLSGIQLGDLQWIEISLLAESMNRLVADLSETLGMSTDMGRALMTRSWNKEKVMNAYFEDTEKVLKDAGLECWVNGEVTLPDTHVCEVCFCEEDRSNLRAAPCGHIYCVDCYKSYLHAKLDDGPTFVKLTCLAPKCNTVLSHSMKTSLLSPDDLKKSERFEVENFITANRSYRFCPGANCTKAVKAIQGTKNVRCYGFEGACGTWFCFGCGLEAHEPVTCGEWEMWSAKQQQESENAKWILSHTKNCPKCRTRIEKNQGCNHMTCRVCGHHFCWICMGPWSEHGERTGGYYKCNKYDPSNPVHNGSAAKSKKDELDRYLHYFSRYNNHHKAEEFATDHIIKLNEKVEIKCKENKATKIDFHYLDQAMDTLVNCRRVLKYTYVFSFYMSEDSVKRQLFEDQQEHLEKFTEILSELTENEVEMIPRSQVINYTKVTEKFMNQILLSVRDGEFWE